MTVLCWDQKREKDTITLPSVIEIEKPERGAGGGDVEIEIVERERERRMIEIGRKRRDIIEITSLSRPQYHIL